MTTTIDQNDWRALEARLQLQAQLCRVYQEARDARDAYRALRQLIPPQRHFRAEARTLREQLHQIDA